MALDTRGAMHGFAQGFGMMDQHYNNQHRQQMDREILGLRQEEAEWNREARGRQKQQWQQEDTDRDLKNIFTKAQTHGWESLDETDRSTVQRIQQQNPSLLPPELSQWEQNNSRKVERITQEATGLKKQVSDAQVRQSHGYKQAVERASKLNLENSEFVLSKLLTGSGELTPEEDEALDEAPAGLMMMGTPEMDAALQSVDEQMAIISSGENIHATPQFLESVNLIYENQIGEGKRIVGIYPGKRSGTVVFELEVDGEDGPYRAPMTANRGTEADDDNEIKQVPIEDLIDSLQGAKALHMAFKADPEAQQRLTQFAQLKGYLPKTEQWITQQDAHGRVTRINAKTGRAESVHGHLPADHPGLEQSSGKFRREQISQFSKDYTKIITDPEMINFPEQQKQAIDALETHYAKTLGVPKKELTRLITYNAQGLVDDQTHRSIMNMHERLEEPEQVTQEGQSPVAGLTQPPSKTTKLGQQQIQDDLKNIDGLEGTNLYSVRQAAKILQDDSEGITGQGLRWMINQGRDQQERQNQQRSETANRPAQTRIEQALKGEQVQIIQQQLQQLKAGINAGDPKAIELAQKLSARLAEITSQ